MRYNRFNRIKELCANETFNELLSLAIDEDITPGEADALYKKLMGERPSPEAPKRPPEIQRKKPERLKEIEEIEERNLYNRWLREMHQKGLLEEMEEEGRKDPYKLPLAVFRRLRESGQFEGPSRPERIKPTTPHMMGDYFVTEEGKVKYKGDEPETGELPFEGEKAPPPTRKYTPGIIATKKCPVCGFLNSPVFLDECKNCKRLYEWMEKLIEEGHSLNEAIMEVYKPIRSAPPGAQIPMFDRLTTKTRNFISPDVLKYIYRTKGETELGNEDIVEIPTSSPYLKLQNELDTTLNVERDPKTNKPVYDENGNPIPLEWGMRKYVSLSELAKRLLMSPKAVVQGIAEYNSEHGLMPERYYIPGRGREPGERPIKPEEMIPRKGTGIAPVRDYSIYPTKEKAQFGVEPKYYQIYEADKVLPAFRERLAELPSIFRQMKIIGFERRIERMRNEINAILDKVRAIKKGIRKYKHFRTYNDKVAKALKRLETLRESSTTGPLRNKLEKVIGHVLDAHNEKINNLEKDKLKVVDNLKDLVEKKKKEEIRRNKYEKWISKKYPAPLTLKDLIEMQKNINLDELQKDMVEIEEGPVKKSMRERINMILKLAIDEPYLPGFEPEFPKEEEKEEIKEEETPETFSGVQYFQPEVGEERAKPRKREAPKMMTKKEIVDEMRRLEGPKIDETFGDKKGKYVVYFEFKIRKGPNAGHAKRFRATFSYTPEYKRIPFEVLLQRKIEQRFKNKIMEVGATPGTYVRMIVQEPKSNETRVYSFFIDEEGRFEWLSTLKEERAEKERMIRLPENIDLFRLWEGGQISLDEMAIVGGKLIEKSPAKKEHSYLWLKKQLKNIEQTEKAEEEKEKAKLKLEEKRRKLKELQEKELAGLTPEEIEQEKEELKTKFKPGEPEFKEPEEKEKEMVKVKCPNCGRDNWVEKGKEGLEICKACEFPTSDLTFVVRRKVPKTEIEEKLTTIPVSERIPGQKPYKVEEIKKRKFYFKYSMVSFERDAQGSLVGAKCWNVPTRQRKSSPMEYEVKMKTFPDLWEKILEPYKPIISELERINETLKHLSFKPKTFDNKAKERELKKRKRVLGTQLKELKSTKNERYEELVSQEHPNEEAYKTETRFVPMVGPPAKPCEKCSGIVKPPFSNAPCIDIKSVYDFMTGKPLEDNVNVWPAAQMMDVESKLERKYAPEGKFSRFDRIHDLYKISCK